MYLEIQYKNTKNPVGVIRNSYRENGKVKHKQFGRITNQSIEQLKKLQMVFNDDVLPSITPEDVTITSSKEYGASFTILELIKSLGLDLAIYSKPKSWKQNIYVMIAGRIIFAGSKLSLCNQYNNTALWELCGIESRPDVRKHCYDALDKLLKRQTAIQKKLANKHLKDGNLVLYDVTSSYLEGEYESSELVKFGYNRDGKKGHEQIVIGLICNSDGCPIAVEVFAGNTKDETTLIGKINELQKLYQIKKTVFVGDRGMVTESTAYELKQKGIESIGALNRPKIVELIKQRIIEASYFNPTEIKEVSDPKVPERRYCLCKNPKSAKSDKITRNRLIELVVENLEKIANYKQRTTVEILGSRIGKLLQKYKIGKYINWEIQGDKEQKKSLNHKVVWNINEELIAENQKLDGCYVIVTGVSKDSMNKEQVVSNYKKLTEVEMAFRNLKTVQLEMRPIYHKLDHRIKAHIFLCMLAYYVQWNMQQRLTTLFEENKKGWERMWTFTQVIETLKSITQNTIKINGITLCRNTCPNQEQFKILKLLGVNM